MPKREEGTYLTAKEYASGLRSNKNKNKLQGPGENAI